MWINYEWTCGKGMNIKEDSTGIKIIRLIANNITHTMHDYTQGYIVKLLSNVCTIYTYPPIHTHNSNK